MTATPLWPPISGHYKMRLGKKAAWSAVRIWLGQFIDDNGDPRGMFCWRAEINGREVDIHDAWPYCAGRRIDKAEYDYMRSVHEWAASDAPHSPEANPRKPVDFIRMPTIF
jgi:hypothetical protein